ncbi:hypothetical protein ACPZ19_48465 [Amycolatopsis lurida]
MADRRDALLGAAHPTVLAREIADTLSTTDTPLHTSVSQLTVEPESAHDNGLQRMQAAVVELMSAKQLLYDWLPTLGQIRKFHEEHPRLSHPAHFSL